MSTVADTGNQLRLTRTVVLVGLMGAGKTSVGKRLAAILKVPFSDSDQEIEAAAGMSVSEIFEKFGEPYFRNGERRVISRLLDAPPSVLATGGGAFLAEDNRKSISEKGMSVWLKADLQTLWDRVKDRTTRPLLMQDNPRQVLSDLFDAREQVYSKAQLHVLSEPGQSHDAMVKRILEALHTYDQAHPEMPPILTKVPA